MKKTKSEMSAMPEMKDDDDHEADMALSDLERAQKHRENKDLMKRVAKRAGRKVKALTGLSKEITSLDDLRKVAKRRIKEIDSEDA